MLSTCVQLNLIWLIQLYKASLTKKALGGLMFYKHLLFNITEPATWEKSVESFCVVFIRCETGQTYNFSSIHTPGGSYQFINYFYTIKLNDLWCFCCFYRIKLSIDLHQADLRVKVTICCLPWFTLLPSRIHLVVVNPNFCY